MKLADKAADQLARLDSFSGSRTLIAEDDGICIECDLLAAEAIGCSFDELRLVAAQPDVLDAAALRARAEGIAQRVDYLLEPLCAVEVDEPGGVALVRSSPPDKRREGQTAYYEIRLTAERRLSLRRWQAQDHSRRDAIPCHTTKETFTKLVDDLAESLA